MWVANPFETPVALRRLAIQLSITLREIAALKIAVDVSGRLTFSPWSFPTVTSYVTFRILLTIYPGDTENSSIDIRFESIEQERRKNIAAEPVVESEGCDLTKFHRRHQFYILPVFRHVGMYWRLWDQYHFSLSWVHLKTIWFVIFRDTVNKNLEFFWPAGYCYSIIQQNGDDLCTDRLFWSLF